MSEISFQRYLAAKRTVDDRALNQYVWRTLLADLPVGPRNVLEIGAGTGAMIARLGRAGGLLAGGRYTGIDAMPDNIAAAEVQFATQPFPGTLELEAIDLFEFLSRETGRRQWTSQVLPG